MQPAGRREDGAPFKFQEGLHHSRSPDGAFISTESTSRVAWPGRVRRGGATDIAQVARLPVHTRWRNRHGNVPPPRQGQGSRRF